MYEIHHELPNFSPSALFAPTASPQPTREPPQHPTTHPATKNPPPKNPRPQWGQPPTKIARGGRQTPKGLQAPETRGPKPPREIYPSKIWTSTKSQAGHRAARIPMPACKIHTPRSANQTPATRPISNGRSRLSSPWDTCSPNPKSIPHVAYSSL